MPINVKAASGLDALSTSAAICSCQAIARRLSVPALLDMAPDRISVAAGEGAFASEVEIIELAGHEMPMVRARTWIARDSMSGLQEARIVEDSEPGNRLDDAYVEFRKAWRLPPNFMQRSAAPQR